MRRIVSAWCLLFLAFASQAFAQEIILEEEDAKAMEKQQNDPRTCPGTEGFEIWSGCPKGGPQFWTGIFHRGVVSENGKFVEKLGFEGGLRFSRRFDLGLGFGQMFKEGADIQTDLRGRFFLMKFPQTGGPYLGGGLLLKTRQVGYVTLGFFGGSGLFFELQFRKSHRQPVAVIPSWGFRLLFL
jgi:hypothetical protein